MERFDLTLDRFVSTKQGYEDGANWTHEKDNPLNVFRKRKPFDEFEFSTPLDIFQETIHRKERAESGAVHTGTGEDIILKKFCDGFCCNDNVCDCCGKPTPPWHSFGLCESCQKIIEGKENIDWLTTIPEEFLLA